MMRCARYRDRPGQADQLHVDLWWRGHNVLADPGTYSYGSAAPWNNALATTRVHNALTIDAMDQMERGPRFLWFGWAQGSGTRRRADGAGRLALLEGEHDGYVGRLGVSHRRALISLGGFVWLILDRLDGSGDHELSAQWLFPRGESAEIDGSRALVLTPAGDVGFAQAVAAEGQPQVALAKARGEAQDVLGWFAPRYLEREPALALIPRVGCRLPAVVVTALGLGLEAPELAVSGSAVDFSAGPVRGGVQWSVSSTEIVSAAWFEVRGRERVELG